VAFHNSTMSKIRALLLVAWGTAPENPRAKEWRDWALVKLYEGKSRAGDERIRGRGGFTEAGWYLRGCLWNLCEALELARRFEGYDGFAKAPRFWVDRIAYECSRRAGDLDVRRGTVPMEGDGSQIYGGQVEFPRHTRRILAQYWRGSELARTLTDLRADPPERLERRGAFVDFLYDEGPSPNPFPSTPSSSPTLLRHRKVFARSDWTATRRGSIRSQRLLVRPPALRRRQFRNLPREPLATESGEYDDYGSDTP